MTEDGAVRAGKIARPEGGERPGACGGDHRAVDDGERGAGLRAVERDEGKLAGEPKPVVLDEVTDDLHAAHLLWSELGPEDIEVSLAAGRPQVHARLQH